jgi:glycosyltransferase involved in cell wall biosynthesis
MPEGARVHLVIVDQPFIAGHPPATADWRFERLEYVLWQLKALRVARGIQRRHDVDYVWHASWSTVWLGSIGGLIGGRFIWGPVGGGVGPPWPVLGDLGARGALTELLRWVVRRLARWLNPLVYLAWSRADLILAQNVETAAWLPRRARSRVEVFHRIALEGSFPEGRAPRTEGRPPTALFAGRLLPWKGAWLAIDAVARLDGWRLVIAGEGPDEGRLRQRARRLGIDDRVTFVGQLERTDVLRAMREDADVFLFPSLREEGGWVVGEALAVGLPVVCVDRGGPPAIGGVGVPLGNKRETAARLADALVTAYQSEDALPLAPTLERRRTELVALMQARRLLATDMTAREERPGPTAR